MSFDKLKVSTLIGMPQDMVQELKRKIKGPQMNAVGEISRVCTSQLRAAPVFRAWGIAKIMPRNID
jgi:hypothetical protein